MLRERAGPAQISPDSVERLANTLLDLAQDQDVRVIEALAAVLARQERDDHPEAYGGLCEAGSQRRFAIEPTSPDAERRAICLRIARRALHGTLVDPTGGATAVHRVDLRPAWARDLLPVRMFGPFLFYRSPPQARLGDRLGGESSSGWALATQG